VHVPYRGGAPALADVLGGQVQMMFEGSSVVIPYAREGQLRALAIATATRSAEIPDVPTMIESGVAGFTPYSWSGIVAPAGTPAGVVALLNGAVNKALASPAMQASLGRLGAEARIGSPADFSAFIAGEMRKWGELVRISGARID
jgi:tripartite-type tricarboxylate transporter receptor subunit TctC